MIFSESQLQKLRQKAGQMGIELDDNMLHQYDTFTAMLLERNKVMNLTAITDPDEVIDKHLADSISAGPLILGGVRKRRMIDVGTGAGFPGIPLKIAFDRELELTLMDSLNKRIGFLQEVKDRLGLSQTKAVHARAEDLARDKAYREKFDICTSRAVANLSTLCEYCLPFVKTGGIFCAYKAPGADKEVEEAKKAIRLLGGKLEKVENLTLPGTQIGRTLVIIKKIGASPRIYPRKAGTPSKDPIH